MSNETQAAPQNPEGVARMRLGLALPGLAAKLKLMCRQRWANGFANPGLSKNKSVPP